MTAVGLTRWPCSHKASAHGVRLFVVHRNGDSGSPRVPGSMSRNESGSNAGSCSVSRWRPPPGRRRRPAGRRSDSARSCNPRRMVDRPSPVTSETSVTPPYPKARASAAAARRLVHSLNSSCKASHRFWTSPRSRGLASCPRDTEYQSQWC